MGSRIVTEHPFSDVIKQWQIEPTRVLAELGIMTGYDDGTFRPEQPITRGEVAAAIYRSVALLGPDLMPVGDVAPPVDPAPDPDPVPTPDPAPEPTPPAPAPPSPVDGGASWFGHPEPVGTGDEIVSAARYALHVKPGEGGKEYRGLSVRSTNTGKSKAILIQDDATFYNLWVRGGADGIHQTGGHLRIFGGIVEEIIYPDGSHSDVYQARGGTIEAYGVLLVCGANGNRPAMLNLGQGAYFENCGFIGGGYGLQRDSDYKGDVVLRDCKFGYGTFGFDNRPLAGSGIDHEGSVWWNPLEMRPRLTEPRSLQPFLDTVTDVDGNYIGPTNGTPIA